MGLKRKSKVRGIKQTSNQKKRLGAKLKKKRLVSRNIAKTILDPNSIKRINLKKLGLAESANDTIDDALKKGRKSEKALNETIEKMTVPFSEKDKNEREFPRSKGPRGPNQKKYYAKLVEKHGHNYKAMFTDLQLNYLQFAESKLKKNCQLLLASDKPALKCSKSGAK
mmetsp:Transcript_20252/g.29923  ORF Transcript_20252/g.29923 Transcript_20252/m.29923 type:complete len:168 (+) Transcript_20252:65-568(+)|eukprot:CAMPEP_0171460050 /NCGR_PEP_ID=MMETSP0945-20130129/5073_1 /TAXON_ID=109269 /ORGANISM="Vaucheria litorea, Strain CCMP2940" /LENGTH=167 /DNA_ID=CAMNT_0011986159 /DNA_START=47 /DNA_END=550 /DNA_ORIENTATION=-